MRKKVSYNRMPLSWWRQKTIVNPLKNIIKLFRIKKIGNIHFLCHVNGRGDRIRTCDPLHPMQVLYQAELHPEQRPDITPHIKKIQLLFWENTHIVVYPHHRVLFFRPDKIKLTTKKEKKCQNQKTNQANVKTVHAYTTQTAIKSQKWKKRIATNNKYNPRIIAGYFYSSLNNRAGSTALLPRRTSRYISGLSGFIRPIGSPAKTSCSNITSIFPRFVITVL